MRRARSTPVRPVPGVNTPSLGELEEKLVLEALRSGRLVKGPMVERFEDAVREVTGTRHAVAVNSGTSALIAALIANGIGPGDEVVTSPFTFVATLNAILHVGATPRFVDIGDDCNIDPDALAAAVGPATRAVVPVHLYGCPANMPAIERAVRGRDIVIVEDAAQALAASVDGRKVGSFGTGCFSFYATKNVTTAEGGMVTTDDDEVARVARVVADQGQSGTYVYDRPGFNFRLSELHAALGVAQMSRLAEFVAARRKHAAFLRAALSGIEGLVLPEQPDGRVHVYHQFTVRVTNQAAIGRDELLARLRSAGVACAVYYPRPVFEYECFADLGVSPRGMPRVRRFAREVLSLAVQPSLELCDLELTADTVRRLLT